MGTTLIDQMQSLIENLDVEEVEVYYENSKNILDNEEASSVHILYYPESKDMIEVANLVQNELVCENYKRSSIAIDFLRGLDDEIIKARPIRKQLITFEKGKLSFKNDDFKTSLKKAMLKVSEDKERLKKFTCRFELKGNKKLTRWDESYEEFSGIDIWYYEKLLEALDAKYPDSLDNINDYRYTLSYLRREDLDKVERLLEDFESKMDCCYIDYEFIDIDDEV